VGHLGCAIRRKTRFRVLRADSSSIHPRNTSPWIETEPSVPRLRDVPCLVNATRHVVGGVLPALWWLGWRAGRLQRAVAAPVARPKRGRPGVGPDIHQRVHTRNHPGRGGPQQRRGDIRVRPGSRRERVDQRAERRDPVRRSQKALAEGLSTSSMVGSSHIFSSDERSSSRICSSLIRVRSSASSRSLSLDQSFGVGSDSREGGPAGHGSRRPRARLAGTHARP